MSSTSVISAATTRPTIATVRWRTRLPGRRRASAHDRRHRPARACALSSTCAHRPSSTNVVGSRTTRSATTTCRSSSGPGTATRSNVEIGAAEFLADRYLEMLDEGGDCDRTCVAHPRRPLVASARVPLRGRQGPHRRRGRHRPRPARGTRRRHRCRLLAEPARHGPLQGVDPRDVPGGGGRHVRPAPGVPRPRRSRRCTCSSLAFGERHGSVHAYAASLGVSDDVLDAVRNNLLTRA